MQAQRPFGVLGYGVSAIGTEAFDEYYAIRGVYHEQATAPVGKMVFAEQPSHRLASRHSAGMKAVTVLAGAHKQIAIYCITVDIKMCKLTVNFLCLNCFIGKNYGVLQRRFADRLIDRAP